ncbi:MAG: SDR family NAD(P)-dependent oxidoreductase, partial [Rhodospirillaceae bacterium]
MSQLPLDGRRAIFTGGAKSLGLNFARHLARAGARVALGDIADGNDDAADITAEAGRDCFFEHLDVGDPTSVQAFCVAVDTRWGGIDIRVNNAAIFATARLGPFEDGTADEWNRMLAVNVTGAFLLAKHAVGPMARNGFGRIVNIGSGTAHKGMPR